MHACTETVRQVIQEGGKLLEAELARCGVRAALSLRVPVH